MRNYLSLILLVTFQSSSLFSNVVSLSSFTKDIIDEYYPTCLDKGAIIATSEDTLYWYMEITSGKYINWFAPEKYIGKVKHNRSDVYLYGLRDCIFYSTNRRSPGIRCQVESKDKNGSMPEIIEEPSFWQIAIRKDTTFSKYRTYIVNAFEDISAIQNIANKYYKSSGVPKDEVFDYIYVEQRAKPKIGIEEIRTIIQNNFHMSYAYSDQRIPIFVELIVYSDGTARVKGLAKRTGNATVDNEALRVADIISKTGFIPAMHRGEYVNSLYAIPFLKEDIEVSREK